MNHRYAQDRRNEPLWMVGRVVDLHKILDLRERRPHKSIHSVSY
jgi:hypothetical protein